MGAIEMLEEIGKLDELIQTKLEECTKLRAMATDISAKPLDGMPYSDTGTVSQKLQVAVTKLIVLEEEIDHIVDAYIDRKKEIEGKLLMLPPDEYGALYRYYILGKPWEVVAEDMHYSRTQIWRLKNRGIELLDEILRKENIS